MQAHDLMKLIALPEQSLKKLSFCASYKAQRVADWASLLRPTQVEKTGATLYAALPEVNQLRCTAAVRFEMLEALRPYVQNTIFGLSKTFVNQPMPLSEAAQKSALIAQSLQKYMADGYCLVVRDLVTANKVKAKQIELLCSALHRAITGFGLIMMRGLQIYTPEPEGLWLNMHSLFRCADLYDLLDERVNDPIQRKGKLSSIQNCYLRSVLLSSCKPMQLPQKDIPTLYDYFGEWAAMVSFRLDLSDDPECFFYLNLDKDLGPIYENRIGDDEKQQLLVELNLRSLTNQIAKQESDEDSAGQSAGLKIGTDFSPALLQHLLSCWSGVSQRRHERRGAKLTAEVGVGLNDCHYFCNNNQDFNSFISGQSSDEIDSNIGGFTPADSFSNSEPKSAERPIYRLEIQNISQGGYCLVWKGSSELKIQAGEVIVLREFGKPSWQLGVIRWIRQRRSSSQFGLQILSDKADAYGIAQTYDMGGYSDYMRALLLPADSFSKTEASMLTASAPFRAGDKVKLIDGEKTYSGKLEKCLFATNSVQQFSLRITESKKIDKPANAGSTRW
ncbi:PilZ domain-containing protein [Agaribacterium haliotis]|uniref:PilZ domain-containing protein n=1 Tax=Agaribacterium haliotis TaxID=2013869 RepID=UPI00117850A3|nr:PilZ domain-containing protein [Agaribacterium haliotis]